MATPISVSFHTLGCKLNFSETSAIRRQFEAAGYVIQPFEQGSDVTVINTCSVTDFADRKCRKSVRTALRNNPASKVVIIGCYAQLKPDEIAQIEGVDLVLGAADKFKILDYIELLDKTSEKGWTVPSDIAIVNEYTSAFSFGDRTRSFLKVQDGCNYQCSFCTIPQARGRSRSTDIDQILSQVYELAAHGAKEIVLTGVNIGDFGIIDGRRKQRFLDLLTALDQVCEISRFRISSIEPNLCSEEIIQRVRSSQRIVPHFHLPLQSGNNKQLRMMQRRYRRELYEERVRQIRKEMPYACIGADVIVGFPGETEADFEASYDFISSLDVNYLHVFTYSERANTRALQIKETVPMSTRRARNTRLRSLSDRKKVDFTKSMLGQTRKVLLEKSSISSHWTGFTDNYVKVLIADHKNNHKLNELVNVNLASVRPDGLVLGKIRNESPASISASGA